MILPERKRFFDALALAATLQSYDEVPIVLDHIDPQLFASYNSAIQPFFLICEKDCVLAALSGRARVEYRESSVRYLHLEPGDFCYVPAGTPHRIVPAEPSLHIRYKARLAGREGMCWYCEACGALAHRIEWATDTLPSQEAYARGCAFFAETLAGRPCGGCGRALPAIAFDAARWDAIADALRNAPPA